jgi:hypothetical protein
MSLHTFPGLLGRSSGKLPGADTNRFQTVSHGRFPAGRWIGVTVAVLAMFATSSAQEIGDSEDDVIALLGTPSASRNAASRKTCIFRNGTKVVFENGLAVEITGEATAVPLPQSESQPLTPPAARSAQATPARPRPEARTRASSQSVASPTPSANGFSKNLPDMGALGGLIAVAGLITIVVCSVIILVQAFSKSILWGLAVFFFPIAQWLFVALYWSDTRKPFLIQIFVGIPAVFIGASL